MSTRRLILLKTGATLADIAARRGDFEHWFAWHLGWPLDHLQVIDVRREPIDPPPEGVDGVFVTGSGASVHERLEWSVRAGAWLARAVRAGVPVLAVCYGHQLLADALGGASGPNPSGREIGRVEVELTSSEPPDPLFEGLPARFPVLQTHTDAVLRPPPGARVLAGTRQTPIQAMAIGARCRSVQWHPEFDGDVLRTYLASRAALLDAERGPGSAARLMAACHDTPSGPRIFANFVRHFL